MRFKKTAVRIICCLLAVVSLLGSTVFSASAKTLDELQKELDELQKDQAEIKSEINAIKDNKNKQIEYKNALLSQVNNTKAQIQAYIDGIAALDGDIATNDEAIAKKEAELNELKRQFKLRMRRICMNGGDSANALLSVIVSDNSFAEILAAIKYSETLARHDEKVMKEIIAAVELIEKKQIELEAARGTLSEYQAELMEKKAELDAQVAEVNRVLASLNQSQNQLEGDYAELKKKAEEVENAIKLAALGGNTSVFDGTFMWPLPGKKSNYWISSYADPNRKHPVYGYNTPHTGNDYVCSGINGMPIYAAAAGTIAIAANDVGGFGFYVMINHGKYQGNAYSTLYAHMTRYVVSAGQVVKKGDLIGYVGRSGAATGPHLHLEVRINGQWVLNPDPYFK